VKVELTVNGKDITAGRRGPRLLLVHFLRDVAGLTRDQHRLRHHLVRGLHGAAGRRVGQVLHGARRPGQRAEVTTVEGLAGADGEMHPVQRAFRRARLQCGFCTPGMVMAPSRCCREPASHRGQVRTGLEGNLCRCTGYHNIVRAALAAADSGKVSA
jgi:carbon-monoxide dehydrogenase small subunit